MAEKGFIILSQKEMMRVNVILKVLGGEIKQKKAAELLGLSVRQVRRITKRVRIEGNKGIAHRSRGRPSNRRLPGEMREKVIGLYRKKYNDFGPTLASEKLFEIDKIKINEETLRRWLIGSGDWDRVRKMRKHRQWRQRKDYFGEMVQMDGSHHDWFEGRGEEAVFMGCIDDATGKVFGRFYRYEGTIPALDSFKRYIKRNGIPASVYVDNLSTYKSTAKPSTEENLSNTEPLSEFERALKELGVEVIHANSPQAKGRIERLFGTLQDRLVKEMRLRNISGAEEANEFLEEYLPKHNKRFAIAAKERGDLHRRAPRGMDIDRILCIKTQRALRNDFTICYENKLYQVEDNIRAKKVTVEERIDGSIRIACRDRSVRFREIAARPEVKQRQEVVVPKERWVPSQDHPWRRWRLRRQTVLAARLSPLGSQQERAKEMSYGIEVVR
jgi:transposase